MTDKTGALGSKVKPVLCKKCGTEMKPSQAIAQTYVGGEPDFPGETHSTTFSAGGPGVLIDCLKCPECGWSITK